MANGTAYRIRTARRAGAEAAVNLRQRRAWFDEQGQPNNGQQPPPAPPTPAPDTAMGTNNNSGKKLEFTQEEFNKLIDERLKRQEDSLTKKFLESLGVDSIDAAKTALDAKRQADEAQKTEAQKLQERIEAAEKKAKEAEERAAKLDQERQIERRDSEIKAALRDARAKKPDSVLILMTASQPDMVKAVLGEDGKVNETALKKLVEEAKKQHAELFSGSIPGSPSNNNGRPPEPDKDAKARASQRQASQIRRGF
jgi:hypothetical protein